MSRQSCFVPGRQQVTDDAPAKQNFYIDQERMHCSAQLLCAWVQVAHVRKRAERHFPHARIFRLFYISHGHSVHGVVILIGLLHCSFSVRHDYKHIFTCVLFLNRLAALMVMFAQHQKRAKRELRS